MSLSMLMTTLAEYVGDVLVNDCGAPAPDRVLRYHGAIPADCCTENGTLAVSWNDGFGSQDFPNNGANAKAAPCSAIPLYSLSIRYRVCWPVPEANANGVELIDPQWDGVAAQLADVADCVSRALLSLACTTPAPLDSFQRAVLANVSRGWLRFVDVAPILPLGGCAGVLWRMSAAPTPGPVS